MIKDRRNSKRIPMQVNSSYLEENKQKWQDCSVIDVSSDGIGIVLYLKESIHVGSKLSFAINIASKMFQPTGTVMWSKKLKWDTSFNSALGVKLAMTDDTTKSDLFKYACSNFFISDKQWEEEKSFL